LAGEIGEEALGWELVGGAGASSGIGGNDSSSAAPNDDVGLNGFKPANPVRWDLTGGKPTGTGGTLELDADVAPVG